MNNLYLFFYVYLKNTDVCIFLNIYIRMHCQFVHKDIPFDR